jgi:hypothetical protein
MRDHVSKSFETPQSLMSMAYLAQLVRRAITSVSQLEYSLIWLGPGTVGRRAVCAARKHPHRGHGQLSLS